MNLLNEDLSQYRFFKPSQFESKSEVKPVWYKNYESNVPEVDYFVEDYFYSFEIQGVADNMTVDELNRFLARKASTFYALNRLKYDKLWEIESINFSPIENYDSTTSRTVVRTGNEINNTDRDRHDTDTFARDGSIQNKEDITGTETDTETDGRVIVTETHPDTVNTTTTTRNQTSTQTTKNNQSYTDTHGITAYNSNEISTDKRTYDVGTGDTVSMSYSGDPDMSQETQSGSINVSERHSGDLINAKTFKDRSNTNTTSFSDYTETRKYDTTRDNEKVTKTYNDVKDTIDEHTHGNIGVTTSTHLMSEYVDFYSAYSFFKKLLTDYVFYICKGVI